MRPLKNLILLVAMIGAILLTLNQSYSSKRQDLFYQINRKLSDSLILVK